MVSPGRASALHLYCKVLGYFHGKLPWSSAFHHIGSYSDLFTESIKVCRFHECLIDTETRRATEVLSSVSSITTSTQRYYCIGRRRGMVADGRVLPMREAFGSVSLLRCCKGSELTNTASGIPCWDAAGRVVLPAQDFLDHTFGRPSVLSMLPKLANSRLPTEQGRSDVRPY